MSLDQVKFGLWPRFYILCYVSEEMGYKFIELIREKLENEKLKITGIQFLELIDFKFDSFDTLGAIEIRLEELTLDYMNSIDYNLQTADLYAYSQSIERAIEEVNKSTPEDVFLDSHNPPYFVAIANSSTLGEIEWTSKNINSHKISLSRWIEFYSGQFTDYSDELYNTRIQNNLSNRLSELHFIRLNSSFIYMERNSWLNKYGDYMEKYFINQILRTKALLLSFYVLNLEIDKSNKFLHSLEDPTLKQLQGEIDDINKKKILIDNLNDELVKEQMMNRRAHSKKTLETCLQLFSIPFVREETNNKVQRLQQELDNERADQQQKFSDSQKKWLLILNILLGSSVLFTLVDKIKTNYLIEGHELYKLLGPDISKYFSNWAEPIILIFLGLIAIIGGSGLAYNFLKRQIGFRTVINFFKRNKGEQAN